jgi:hypothetical protein
MSEIERARELDLPDDDTLAIAWQRAGIEHAIASRPTASSPGAAHADAVRVAIIEFLIGTGVVSSDVHAGGEAFLRYLAEAPFDFSAYGVLTDEAHVDVAR